jgi:hypothetical protein
METDFRELIGVAPGPIRWVRVAGFVVGCVVADLLPWIWFATHGGVMHREVVQGLLVHLLLPLAAVAAFRGVREPFTAAGVAAAAYAIASWAARVVLDPAAPGETSSLVRSFAWAALFLGACVLAVRLIPVPWTALAIASAGSDLLVSLTWQLVELARRGQGQGVFLGAGPVVHQLVIAAVSGAVFATAVTVAVAMSKKP